MHVFFGFVVTHWPAPVTQVTPILEAFREENHQRLVLVKDLGIFTTEALRLKCWSCQLMGSCSSHVYSFPFRNLRQQIRANTWVIVRCRDVLADVTMNVNEFSIWSLIMWFGVTAFYTVYSLNGYIMICSWGFAVNGWWWFMRFIAISY